MESIKKAKVLLVGCSIRNIATDKEIIGDILGIPNEHYLKEHIERKLRAEKVSNSERGLMSATLGLKEYNVSLEYVRLNDYFHGDGTNENVGVLIEKLLGADGIIFSTPVYFGAETSLLWGLYKLCRVHNIDLFPRVVGFISTGAKRNGGQESTIIFASWRWMELGAIVHNEGYPRSQFGGICVAGSIGSSIEKDSWGVMTCVALGRRIAQTALILKNGSLKTRIIVSYWMGEDINTSLVYDPKLLKGTTRQGIPIFKYNIHRCLGCQVCPAVRDEKENYKCFKRDDDIFKIHGLLVGGDAIIPVGYDLKFHERTRYLRRDNYRLTYHVVHMPEPQYIPLFMKENSILCRRHLVNYAKLIKSGRKKVKTEVQIYEPIGHERVY